MRSETSISIAATPERVWAVMQDVERWPEWTPTMTGVQRLDEGEFKVGSRVKIKQPKFPSVVWTVTSLEPGRGFEWQARSPGSNNVGIHRIEPEGEGSRVTLAVEQAGLFSPLLALFYGGVTRRYIRQEAEGLKQRCEAAT